MRLIYSDPGIGLHGHKEASHADESVWRWVLLSTQYEHSMCNLSQALLNLNEVVRQLNYD